MLRTVRKEKEEKDAFYTLENEKRRKRLYTVRKGEKDEMLSALLEKEKKRNMFLWHC